MGRPRGVPQQVCAENICGNRRAQNSFAESTFSPEIHSVVVNIAVPTTYLNRKKKGTKMKSLVGIIVWDLAPKIKSTRITTNCVGLN